MKKNIWLSSLRSTAKSYRDNAHTNLVVAVYAYADALSKGIKHLGDLEECDRKEEWEEYGGDYSITVHLDGRVSGILPDWEEFHHDRCPHEGSFGCCDCSPPDLHLNLLDKLDMQSNLKITDCVDFLDHLDTMAGNFALWGDKEKDV